MTRAASLFVLLSAAALHAQPPPPPPPPPPPHNASQTGPLTGTGTIRGRVLADDGGEPLRKARVVVGGPTSIPPAFTDDQGRFAFTKLPAGQYALTARKAGYASAAFGSRRPGEPPMRIDLAAGGTVDGIDVRMMRGAAISGRLVDEFGEPVENAIVFAERVVRVAGRTSTTSQASTLSDDLGEYRLGGLPSGTYVVVARVTRAPVIAAAAGGTVVFGGIEIPRSRTYYPGVVALADAQRIDVQVGEERPAVDFGVLAPRAIGRLALSFVDAKGNPT
jgi:Carboxypeptidase regulatory-like domain